MSETSTTAMLVGTPDMFAASANAITATVPRYEIEEALASEPPAELVLDVMRAKDGDEAERRTVNIAWTQSDLEALLDVDGEAITFYFDPAELERALEDADVEAHGFRETAVVLSIAAAAAVGAGNAFAQPDQGGVGQAGAGTAQVAVGGHDEASLSERGIGLQAVTPPHDEASLAQRGIDAPPPAPSRDEAGLTARGVDPTPPAPVHDEAGLVTRGIQAEPVPIHDEAGLVTRGIVEETPATVGDTGGGFEFPTVDAQTAAAVSGAVAGAGLLIVAAAFATRRRIAGHP
jgi:hypothetical protein